ncbi:MAG: hypothetical protein WBP85_07185 [Terracidiphilus sp.]
MSYMECRHIKSNGCKCHAAALRGMPYCYFHARLHRALHNQKANSETLPPAVPGVELDLPAVEDRTAIQLALTQVLQGMGSRRIDPRFGTQLLYGLQIAAQLIDPPRSIAYSEYVQDLTTSDDGDELGPLEFTCKSDEKCDTCPYVDRCTNEVETGDEDDADNSDDESEDDDDEEDESE